MAGVAWRIGEVARRAGLSVRTLRHDDDLGVDARGALAQHIAAVEDRQRELDHRSGGWPTSPTTRWPTPSPGRSNGTAPTPPGQPRVGRPTPPPGGGCGLPRVDCQALPRVEQVFASGPTSASVGRMTPRAPTTGPGPDGALEVVVRCRTSPTGVDDRTHPVTIHPDWSVTTPHDIEAERVGMALGGYCSCVELVDVTVPALRSVLGLLTHPVAGGILPAPSRTWTVERPHACCRSRRYPSIVRAARHLRTPTHLAAVVRAQRRAPLSRTQFEQVLAGAELSWGSFQHAPPHPARELVREEGGLDDLWVCGIPPEEVERLAALAAGVTEPLPVAYYLAWAYGTVDGRWLSEAVARCPDPDTATWLAWRESPQSRAPASEWGGWLGLGVPRRAVLALVDLGVPVQRVPALATTLALPRGTVARELGTWALVGCTPTLRHFIVLRDRGIAAADPSARAVDLLCAEVGAVLGVGPAAVDRTDVAVLLEALGTRRAVLDVVRRGVRRAEQLLDLEAVDRCGLAAG